MLIFVLNIALITVCLVMVTIPLGTLFLLAMLIAAAKILAGFDLIAFHSRLACDCHAKTG